MARALNRSIASGKTALVRAISQDMGLKVSDVRDRVQLYAATPAALAARCAPAPSASR